MSLKFVFSLMEDEFLIRNIQRYDDIVWCFDSVNPDYKNIVKKDGKQFGFDW